MGTPITITNQETVILEDRTVWPGAGGFLGAWQLVEGFTWINFFMQADADWDIRNEIVVEQNQTLTQPYAGGVSNQLHHFNMTIFTSGGFVETLSTRIRVCARYARVRVANPCGAAPTVFRLLCYAREVK